MPIDLKTSKNGMVLSDDYWISLINSKLISLAWKAANLKYIKLKGVILICPTKVLTFSIKSNHLKRHNFDIIC